MPPSFWRFALLLTLIDRAEPQTAPSRTKLHFSLCTELAKGDYRCSGQECDQPHMRNYDQAMFRIDRTTGAAEGFYVDLLEELAVMGEFTYSFMYEVPIVEGSSRGCISSGKLYPGDWASPTDLDSEQYQEPKASTHVWSVDIFHRGVVLVTRLPPVEEEGIGERFKTFMKPFSPGLWSMVIALWCGSAYVLYKLEYVSARGHGKVYSAFLSWTTFTVPDEHTPVSWAAKVMSFTLMVYSASVVVFYAAKLSAIMSKPCVDTMMRPDSEVRNWRDLSTPKIKICASYTIDHEFMRPFYAETFVVRRPCCYQDECEIPLGQTCFKAECSCSKRTLYDPSSPCFPFGGASCWSPDMTVANHRPEQVLDGILKDECVGAVIEEQHAIRLLAKEKYCSLFAVGTVSHPRPTALFMTKPRTAIDELHHSAFNIAIRKLQHGNRPSLLLERAIQQTNECPQGTGNDPLDPRENIGIAELGIVSCLHLIAIAIAIVIKKGVAEPGTSKSGTKEYLAATAEESESDRIAQLAEAAHQYTTQLLVLLGRDGDSFFLSPPPLSAQDLSLTASTGGSTPKVQKPRPLSASSRRVADELPNNRFD